MFAWPPMTLGCLIEEESHIFDHFPTSYHTDWQWWDILEYSKVMELQDMPSDLRPFIQVIDAFDSNFKLGIGFEAKVGAGKIIVLPLDLQKDIQTRPAVMQLLQSIDAYAHSKDFCPRSAISLKQLEQILR